MNRRLTVPVGAALLAAGLAGCNSSASHPTAAKAPHATSTVAKATPVSGQVIAAAYTTSLRSNTAKVSVNVKTAQSGTPMTITGIGSVDFGKRSEDLTLTVPSVGNIRLLTVGATIYLQLPPALTGQMPGLKPWLTMNVSSLSDPRVKTAFATLSALNAADPGQVFAVLAGAFGGTVTNLGPASIDGTSMTHYGTTINLDALLAASPKLAAQLKPFRAVLGSAELPVQIWVDAAEHLRRVTLTSTLASSATSPLVVEADFTNWGTPVSIKAPVKNQTTDVATLLKSFG